MDIIEILIFGAALLIAYYVLNQMFGFTIPTKK